MRIDYIDFRQDDDNFYFEIEDKDGQTFKVLIDMEDWSRIRRGYRSLVRIFQIGNIPRISGRRDNKDRNWEYLHRFIIGAEEGDVVDHLNHNPLDNRKGNLRILSKSGNTLNRRGANHQSKSGVRGVCWSTNQNSWLAQLQVNKVKICHRYFKNFSKAEEFIKEMGRIHAPESIEEYQEAA